jgi:hypothetical protein
MTNREQVLIRDALDNTEKEVFHAGFHHDPDLDVDLGATDLRLGGSEDLDDSSDRVDNELEQAQGWRGSVPNVLMDEEAKGQFVPQEEVEEDEREAENERLRQENAELRARQNDRDNQQRQALEAAQHVSDVNELLADADKFAVERRQLREHNHLLRFENSLQAASSNHPEEFQAAHNAMVAIPNTPEKVDLLRRIGMESNPGEALIGWNQRLSGVSAGGGSRYPRNLATGVTGSGHLTPREAAMVDRSSEDMDELNAPSWTSDDTATFHSAFRR